MEVLVHVVKKNLNVNPISPAPPAGFLLLSQQPPLRHQRRPQAHLGALVAADDFNTGADAFAQGAHMADDADQTAAFP